MGAPLKRRSRWAEKKGSNRRASGKAAGAPKGSRRIAAEAGKEHPYPAVKPPPGRPDLAGDPAYEPSRTKLGAELRRLRAKIIESGERLLTWEEIEGEVAARRGGTGR